MSIRRKKTIVLTPQGPKNNYRGATLVEFTLIASLLFMVLFAIIQYAMIFSVLNKMTQISRDAARYAAIHWIDPYNASNPNDPKNPDNEIKAFVAAEATTMGVSSLSVTSITPAQNSRSAAAPITVTVQYDMTQQYLGSLVPGASMFKKMQTRSGTCMMEPQPGG